MHKKGLASDIDRRRKHVSKLQDGKAWRKYRELPAADASWATCLIIAPSTVVHNWEREFETVSPSLAYYCDHCTLNAKLYLQWGYFEVSILSRLKTFPIAD